MTSTLGIKRTLGCSAHVHLALSLVTLTFVAMENRLFTWNGSVVQRLRFIACMALQENKHAKRFFERSIILQLRFVVGTFLIYKC